MNQINTGQTVESDSDSYDSVLSMNRSKRWVACLNQSQILSCVIYSISNERISFTCWPNGLHDCNKPKIINRLYQTLQWMWDFSCCYNISLVISLLPALVNWVGDLCYAVRCCCTWLRTYRHHQQLPHTDQVLLLLNTIIIQFSKPNTSMAFNRTSVCFTDPTQLYYTMTVQYRKTTTLALHIASCRKTMKWTSSPICRKMTGG